MLRSVHIRGIGPIEDETFAMGDGATVIARPSGSGKTTLLDSITFALWGRDSRGKTWDVARIRGGVCGVTLALSSGLVLARGLTSDRTQLRAVTGRDGVTAEYTTEAALSARLGALGSRADLCRVILVPGLLQGADTPEGARALRAALLAADPPPDPLPAARTALRWPDLPASALTAKRARELRASARTALAVAEARLSDAGLPPDLLVEEPEPISPAYAQMMQDDLAWGEYAAREQAITLWDEQRARIGDVPSVAPSALADAVDAEWRTRAALDAAQGRPCPTCGHRRRAPDTADVAALQSAHVAAAGVLDTLREIQRRADGLAYLGPRPQAAAPPPRQRPDAAALADARARVAAHSTHAARWQGYRAALESWRTRSTSAAATVDVARASVERTERLVDYVDELLAVQGKTPAAKLDLPPNWKILTDDAGGLTITIGGRPAYLLSHGQRIAADLTLRAALRRLARLPWLPIVADDWVATGLPVPSIEGQTIYLITTTTTEDPT